jgi:Flp pilus assembly protein TadD
MKYPQLKNFWIIAIAVICLHGCSATSPAHENDAAITELSGENLDLLFATEFPAASKDEALMKAASAYRAGDLDKAQFFLVSALKFDNGDADILVQIGNLHLQKDDNVLAARAFQYALQQSPRHAAALEGMGLLYFKVENIDEAQKHLELALESGARLWRSHNALGVIADGHEKFDRAQSHYDTALEIQPRGADTVLINRGYSKYLNNNYHAAELDFRAVIERGNNDKAWRNLGLVYAAQGFYEDALETFLQVGDERDAYNATGEIAMDNGDIQEALYFLTEAVRLSPTYFALAEKNLDQLQKKRSREYVN